MDRKKAIGTEPVDLGYKDILKLQILTVEELLAGKQVQLPPSLHTFKQAEKTAADQDDQITLSFE